MRYLNVSDRALLRALNAAWKFLATDAKTDHFHGSKSVTALPAHPGVFLIVSGNCFLTTKYTNNTKASRC